MGEKREKAVRRYAALVARDGAFCWYCLRELTEETYTEDHYIPKSEGGTRHLDNLRLACFRCNGSKANHPGGL